MAGGQTSEITRHDSEASARQKLLVANALALLLILISALAVVRSTHICRQLYAQLQTLESAQWSLQENYGRLVLEQSTWASHYRVEKVARADLDMQAPDLQRFRVVQQ